jgi:soluble lytic murein transglycosylase-like protein
LRLFWLVFLECLLGLTLLSPLSIPPAQADAVKLVPGEWSGRQRAQKTRRLGRYLHQTYRIHPAKAHSYVQAAVQQGVRHQLKPELILAVIGTESSARERAVSRRGARGLMQVIPRYHGKKIRQVGGSQALFKPRHNIAVGTAILAEQLKCDRGNMRQALLHYSGNRDNPHSRFPDKVLKVYRKLRQVARSG